MNMKKAALLILVLDCLILTIAYVYPKRVYVVVGDGWYRTIQYGTMSKDEIIIDNFNVDRFMIDSYKLNKGIISKEECLYDMVRANVQQDYYAESNRTMTGFGYGQPQKAIVSNIEEQILDVSEDYIKNRKVIHRIPSNIHIYNMKGEQIFTELEININNVSYKDRVHLISDPIIDYNVYGIRTSMKIKTLGTYRDQNIVTLDKYLESTDEYIDTSLDKYTYAVSK